MAKVSDLEVRLEKLEKRKSRADKRPLHIAYAALVIGVASGAIGIVNAMAVNDLTVRLAALTPTPKPAPPKAPIVPRMKGECGRTGSSYFCR